jgi:hypothetical protein
MTTLREFDLASIFEVISDKASLELVQRIVQAEISFHESRATQLKALDAAIGKRLQAGK